MRALAFAALLLSLACKTAEPAPDPKPVAPAPAPVPQGPPDPPVKAAEPVAARPFAVTPPMAIVKVPTARPVVSLRLAFRSGSIDDPPGKEGLTALTTRLMVEGGTKSLSSAQLIDALYPLAAELDGSTDKELTVITGRVHREKLDAFAKIFSDVLLEPRFDEKELDRLRTNSLTAIKNRLRSENDEALGKVVLDSVLYEGHPYRHTEVGTIAALSSITVADVRAHWKNVFTQDRLIIGLGGAVDAKLENQVKALAKKLPATGAPAVALPAAPGTHGHAVIVRKQTASTAGSFGLTYALRRGDPDYFAVALAMSYLGEHRQSHGVLFTELRERRGLNYGDYAYAEHYLQDTAGSIPRVSVPRSTQDMTIWIRPVEPQNAMFAARGAVHFLRQLLETPPSQEQFDTARGFLVGFTRIWEQTDQRRLGWAIDELLYGTPKFLDQYRAALAKLTPADVQAAAKRNLAAENLDFVFVTKDADALAAQLRSRAPSPITYASPKTPEVLEKDKQLEKEPLPIPSSLVRIIDAAEVMER